MSSFRQSEPLEALVRVALTFLLLLLPVSASSETLLFMAEEDGCYWCGRWNNEISHIYSKTSEGQAAPLYRFDIEDTSPRNVVFSSRIRFTPTFVLVRDGIEIDRLEGYPGEDFFWPLLARMLRRANVPFDGAG